MYTPKTRRFGRLMLGGALLLALLAGCGGAKAPQAPAAASGGELSDAARETDQPGAVEIGLAPGQKAPDFSVKDLASGKEITLASLKGKVAVLNFWASWCPPCKLEMPDLQALHEESKEQVIIVAVGVQDSPQAMAGFVREMGLTFTVGVDNSATARAYRVLSIPVTYFIDQNGIVRHVYRGPMTLDYMRERVAETGAAGQGDM